ncbi:cobyrinic acid a,c-diamide synthase [Nitrobacter winogradskyi Nb-255]|uniref:Cobyrinic acid a,c-diamide synthase n=1 Tax=Nitrobacter winogradskyi (strain ATCC 25391 / DSM 10237 / CIP 104748 / NCIMB 11846 / Nb-255) TaxID=323098 RepID=Q3SUE3_NITWN|nr:AAA family ATPase [Nitrobacter winogradskyi]ABA04098.1 cobyrinic acid a,c-diamide synthase [Nitrobacter winogradskyi Nb-255]
MIPDDELVGINEIAEMAKTSRQAVANWRTRMSDFPKPIVDLASGPVFRRSHIRAWLRRRKVPMAHVFSTINLKGGVGKTTTTVALAETLSAEKRKKVLVIDLDPQTNATTMLIGEEKWRELNDKGFTLAQLFKDALNPDSKKFDLKKTLQKRVSDVSSATTIDLLPSSLDLIDVQDELINTPVGKYGAIRPFDILWRATKDLIEDYDVVIIDCPPNLGKITQNGLRMSHGFIIPTIPDILSTYGIPQIVRRVREFSEEIAEDIEPLGIVVTKFQANSNVHVNMLKQLKLNHTADAKNWPPVFDTLIPQANQIAAAAEHSGYSTLKQKWGYQGLHDRFSDLATEILTKLGV